MGDSLLDLFKGLSHESINILQFIKVNSVYVSTIAFVLCVVHEVRSLEHWCVNVLLIFEVFCLLVIKVTK